MISHCKLG